MGGQGEVGFVIRVSDAVAWRGARPAAWAAAWGGGAWRGSWRGLWRGLWRGW